MQGIVSLSALIYWGMDNVSLDGIRAAAARIAGAVERTPCLHSRTLSRLAGCELWLKFENLQFTASFKERGALNKLLLLSDAERGRGVIAMSAGNHAQGVAYHAARLGIRAVIVMPRGTPNNKVKSTQVHGAEVVLEGDTLAEAAAHAQALGAREGLTFIHPYDDAAVIAGQGTVALEMLEAAPELDILVVPIGGGGLISGMATAAKALRPELHVLGVESRTWSAWASLWAQSRSSSSSASFTVMSAPSLFAVPRASLGRLGCRFVPLKG